jgi:hypothetical protein
MEVKMMENDAENSVGTITLYVMEDGSDRNEGSRERPLASIARALEMIRGKELKTAELVLSGTIQEAVAPEVMVAFTGYRLPEITLRGESAERPGILSAEGLDRRVMYFGNGNTVRILEHLVICGGTTDSNGGSGVCIERSTLILDGGIIGDNIVGSEQAVTLFNTIMTFAQGGGVHVCSGSSFTMNAGDIRDNHVMGLGPEKDANGLGGGVSLFSIHSLASERLW